MTEEGSRKWDVLVAWKLDRISRSAEDTVRLLKWCEARGKRIVCVDDGLDTETKMGRVWIQLAAIFAEVERSFIEERTQASRAELRRQGRFAGGTPPYGYQAVKGADGWRIEPHPEQAEVVGRMAEWVISGGSYLAMAKSLNADGVTPPRSDNKAGWSGVRVSKVLENPTVRWGKAVHNGAVLEAVDYAEPLLDAATAVQLDRVMSARSRKHPGRTVTRWLTGIVWCAECGAKMYYAKPTKRGHMGYYRCGPVKYRGEQCTNTMIRAEQVEGFVERRFLAEVGSEELLDKIVTPGADHTAELDAIRGRIAKLAKMFEAGLLDAEDGDFAASLAALKRRRAELEAEPTTPDLVVFMPTGLTCGDAWEDGNDASRRTMLLDRGVTVRVSRNAEARLAFDMPDQEAP